MLAHMTFDPLIPDLFRFAVISHAALFVFLVVSIIFEYKNSLGKGFKSENLVKHEIFLLCSYVLAIIHMTYEVSRQLHNEFSWFITPVVLVCLLLGDVGLYYLYRHKKDNKE